MSGVAGKSPNHPLEGGGGGRGGGGAAGTWNGHWIVSAYLGSHEGIIPKAF